MLDPNSKAVFTDVFKDGHISRFASSFEVIQVISTGKLSSAETVDPSFNSETQRSGVFPEVSFSKKRQ